MKTLKSFEFKSGEGQRGSYDWTKLLDGKVYQLEEGADYTCKSTTFGTLARSRAAKAGVAVRIAKVEGGLVIQQVGPAAPKAPKAPKADKAPHASPAPRPQA